MSAGFPASTADVDQVLKLLCRNSGKTQKQLDLTCVFWFVAFVGVIVALTNSDCFSSSLKAPNAVTGLARKTYGTRPLTCQTVE